MNIQERVWKVGAVVGILLSVFLAVLSVKELRSIGIQQNPVYNTISVTGKGEAVSIPDIATFSFSVTETGKTVTDAQSKASEKLNAALKAVADAGVKDRDVQTASYGINPHYDYQEGVCTLQYPSVCKPGKSVLTGYDVSQSIEVKIRDIKKAGEIFSAIGALNVQNVNGLSFSIDDIEKVKAEARAKAIADAKVKAQKLAKDLGVRIVKITSFYDSSDQPNYYGREGMGGDMISVKSYASAPAVVPQVPTGEQKVVSNVTITYEIK